METTDGQHVFEAQVYLNGLDPDAVRIELYANDETPIRQEMTRVRELVGAVGGYIYRAEVSASRPATDFTARLIPHHEGVSIPTAAPTTGLKARRRTPRSTRFENGKSRISC